MKNQKGFTLIELLLVLAIIGIISAIAIPALLGQRARARDKSSIANADSIISDMVAGWDKAKEGGAAITTTALFTTNILGTAAAPLVPQFFSAKNPWGTTNLGYAALIAETDNLGAATKAAAATTNMGQVQSGFLPVAAGAPGLVSSAVYVNNSFLDSTGTATNIYIKVAGLE